MSENFAAVLPSEKAELVIEPVEDEYTLEPEEVLITNRAIPVNPFEVKLQRYGLYPLQYPTILGIALAGTVKQVGTSVKSLSVGDKVAVSQPMTVLGGSEKRYQVWQRCVVANERHIAKLGENISFEDAAGTISNLITVIAAFTLVMGMGQIAPGQTPSAGKKILIYGGSSSVGGLAIQVAARLGAAVVTTASQKNWAEVEKRTTGKIIDHTQEPDVLVAQMLSAGPYDYVFDTIGGATVTSALANVLSKQNGGTIYSTFVTKETYQLPSGVERKAYNYPSLLQNNEELNTWFNAMFNPALEQGRILPSKTEKVAGGLQALQSCLDKIADEKVSGVKLVVDPWDNASEA